VDGLIITESDDQKIRLIKHQLRDKFDIMDLGYLKYFLGIDVAFSKKIHLEFIEINLENGV
jgi:hypothetical protein